MSIKEKFKSIFKMKNFIDLNVLKEEIVEEQKRQQEELEQEQKRQKQEQKKLKKQKKKAPIK